MRIPDESCRADPSHLQTRAGRAISNGILETAGTTFLLLTVVKGFGETEPGGQGLVATAASVGLLLTPGVVTVVQSLRLPGPGSRPPAWRCWCTLFFLMAACRGCRCLPSAASWHVCSTGAIPLLTQVFRDNYPDARRGHYFARAVSFRVLAAGTFSFLAGWVLTQTGGAGQAGLGSYRWLLVIFGLAFLGSWHCLRQLPSRPLEGDAGGHPFRALRYAQNDKLFRHTLICWMIMGFGNLMMIPIRVDYLANPVYGLEKSELVIAVLTLVIPNVFRLLLNPFGGRMFDRINLFLLRAVLNLFFAAGVLIFFNSDTMAGMVAGQICFGIAHAGGDIAWGLWVTKLAPPNRVADYMSVHTFFTGVRGVLAPVIGFSVLASGLAVSSLSQISGGLILLSAILLIPTIKQTREDHPTQVVTEEISE
ncbi:MAG: hypothetical protein CM1200mP34_3420 [Verrucomicrobiales bacterium]|nr:MAG: hypothetical protein CM1200mP34_3420 [Verrucomicrobiales bacterium]